jgi:hypothetical protein
MEIVLTPAARARSISMVRDMFLDTADMNYVGARTAFFDARDYDFWWLTLHAVEKYLKAALLMNGGKIDNAGHDLPELLARLQRLDARLEPPPFVRPRIAGSRRAFEFREDQFIGNLNIFGSATNRYAVYSYVISDVDLHHADHLVYWARRHARVFRQTIGGEDIDWIHELAESPTLWVHHSGAPLEKLVGLPPHSVQRRAVTRANVAFFPKMRHRPAARGALIHNGSIFNCIQMLKNSSPGSADRVDAQTVLTWVLDEIPLPRIEKTEIRDLLAAHP